MPVPRPLYLVLSVLVASVVVGLFLSGLVPGGGGGGCRLVLAEGVTSLYAVGIAGVTGSTLYTTQGHVVDASGCSVRVVLDLAWEGGELPYAVRVFEAGGSVYLAAFYTGLEEYVEEGKYGPEYKTRPFMLVRVYSDAGMASEYKIYHARPDLGFLVGPGGTLYHIIALEAEDPARHGVARYMVASFDLVRGVEAWRTGALFEGRPGEEGYTPQAITLSGGRLLVYALGHGPEPSLKIVALDPSTGSLESSSEVGLGPEPAPAVVTSVIEAGGLVAAMVAAPEGGLWTYYIIAFDGGSLGHAWTARIQLPPRAGLAAVGGWLLAYSSTPQGLEVVLVDPATGDAVARAMIPGSHMRLSVSGGTVWVAGVTGDGVVLYEAEPDPVDGLRVLGETIVYEPRDSMERLAVHSVRAGGGLVAVSYWTSGGEGRAYLSVLEAAG